MEFFKQNVIYGFMGKSKLFITLSLLTILSSYVLLGVKGLNFGIDFAGGSVIQVQYSQTAPIDQMRQALKSNAIFDGASITEFGSPQEVVIRVKNSTQELGTDLGDLVKDALAGTGSFEIRRVDIVGPKVGSELREKGLMAMVLAIVGILIYVSFRFEWRFAVASVLALVHDVSIAMGAIALFEIDVNLDILAAMLTILGYSLNDTIIVFDRIREGIQTNSKSNDLAEVIDHSISNTLSRTTLTSLTTFFVVLTLFVWGGEIIHGFAFALLVGIVVGTYSSIFVASPILLWFGFDIGNYRNKEAEKQKRELEKAKMRAMYEQGTI